MTISTRITTLLGIEHPVVQGGMSWASSSALLAAEVSRAGGLGVIAAGPMRPDDLRDAIRQVKSMTDKPFAVNVALYNIRAAEHLQIILDEGVPVLIASQGSPKEHIKRFKQAGVKWLHVVAHPDHARKAEAAGVDALIVIGGEAGGHPPPSGVSTLVMVRMIARVARVPIIAGGGVADGAGLVAMLSLGADAAQLGTRFLLTPEATVHANYKNKVLAVQAGGTTLVGWRDLPIRAVRNAFTDEYEAAERAGQTREQLEALFGSRSLKMAALDGDVDQGKVEAGQCAALIEELVPAAQLVDDIVMEAQRVLDGLSALQRTPEEVVI